eukprot:scaffold336457_cov43-Prasinocladus_malaysianus.AAC.1
MSNLLSKMDSRYKERESEIRSKLESQYETQLKQMEEDHRQQLHAQAQYRNISIQRVRARNI